MSNVIKASEGMVLTNGEAYGKEIHLGCNDSTDNWHEITDAKYEEILKEVENEAIESQLCGDKNKPEHEVASVENIETE